MNSPPSPSRQKIFDIVGEAGKTQGGESRQKVLLYCEPGDPLELRREPGNPHDPNAILVLWRDKDIGYVTRECASILAPQLDSGRPHRAQVHRIKGGLPDYPSYGVEFSVAWDGKECPACRPLDERQVRSRRGKIAAAGRLRDESGAFATERSKGCALSLFLLAAPLTAAGGWLLRTLI